MRAQSHVVGITLMLGLTVVALGGLTAATGTLLEEQAASADATRIADEMDAALRPVETTGQRTGRLHFAGGHLQTVERDLRVLRNGSVVERRPVGALVFEAEDRRVAFVAGSIVRGRPGAAWRESDPPIASSEHTGVLVVGAPTLGTDHLAVGGEGGVSVALETTVSHARRTLGRGNYALAVETRTPRPFERFFEAQGATVTRTDFDGDDVPSVVAAYPGQRQGYLVVHDLALEVGHG
jgi:hypothetical protein